MNIEEKIKGIEDLLLDSGDKKNLILVASGLKPNCVVSARFCLSDHYDPSKKIFRLPSGLGNVISDCLGDLDFNYSISDSITESNKYKHIGNKRLGDVSVEIKEIYVGNDHREVKGCLKFIKEKNVISVVDHKKFGFLMGYPNSAVNAWCDEKYKLVDETFTFQTYERSDDRSIDHLRYLDFIPSKDNLEEELKKPKSYMDKISNYSPKIHNHVISFHENCKTNNLPKDELNSFLYTKP